MTENNGITNLLVEVNLPEDFVEFTDKTFPTGLRIVKESAENFCIIVQTGVKAPADVVWEKWNNPDDVIGWNFASDDWCCPKAENDLRIGGKFSYRMEAKDGSGGFDFGGVYRIIAINQFIEYIMADGRIVKIYFEYDNNHTNITITFSPENINSFDLQRYGWQSILNNFKKYVEAEKS
ncbi:MAG: SRPBCC domain-containing protein [bacterium]